MKGVLIAAAAAGLLAIALSSAQAQAKEWKGTCLCQRADDAKVFHIVIEVTDANRADITKRMAAGEGDTMEKVSLVAGECKPATLCGRNKAMAAGSKTVTISYRRLDNDLPFDDSVLPLAKLLTIGGKE
jgi:hypothetical protein